MRILVKELFIVVFLVWLICKFFVGLVDIYFNKMLVFLDCVVYLNWLFFVIVFGIMFVKYWLFR